MAFRILAFDGGGLRGVVSARMLANLCTDSGLDPRCADLLAGTSVGSTNALSLALGMQPADMVRLYADHAGDIFRPTRRRGFFRSVYRTDHQRAAHLAAMAAAGVAAPNRKCLRDLGQRVLVTAFQLNGSVDSSPGDTPAWRARLYHNFDRDSDGGANAALDLAIIDVLLRSSAAPIAFPVYQGFADGGLVAINPSVCAIAQALNPFTGGARLDDVALISFGTGCGATYSLDVETDSWGLVQWAMKAGRFSEKFIDAFADIPAFQAAQLLGERHLRLNAPIPPTVGVDRPAEIPSLIEAADSYRTSDEWGRAVDWVRRWWRA